MKGKLIKTGNDYLLKDTNGEVVAITNGVTEGKKLSKQNCDEIFGVVDVEKLAEENSHKHYDVKTTDWHCNYNGFFSGFQKAMEMNKDKVFTLSDMKRAFNCGRDLESIDRFEDWRTFTHFINSLQSTEIDVEVEMDDIWDGLDSTRIFPKEETSFPFLDPNGCLILKKI